MAGDARVRHCTLCSLNVYNVAEMTRDEVRELLARTEGRVCARLYRRADGTVLTRDCPTGLRAIRQRASRVAAALVAALLSLPALAFGGTTRGPRLKTSSVTLKIERVAAAQRATFTGVVLDQAGTPLPGVTITVRDEATKREVVTDAKGAFTIAALNDGIYRVEMTLAGFTPARMEHLELKAGEVTHASVALRMDTAEWIVMGGLAPMIDTNPGTTTVSQDLLRKLPF
jgi:protocatechuate 3,4-dioxygenase beta subunit